MGKVTTVVCPAVRLPHASIARPGSHQTTREVASSKPAFKGRDGNSKQSGRYLDPRAIPGTSTKDEIRALYGEIKELSSTALSGMAKKKHKEDQLTKLGAPPPKEQKMPFQMKMGILKGRKQRETKILGRAKESGVVVAKQTLAKAKKDKEKGTRKRSSSGPDVGPKIRGGVLRINKSLL